MVGGREMAMVTLEPGQGEGGGPIPEETKGDKSSLPLVILNLGGVLDSCS